MIWLLLGLALFLGAHSIRIFAPQWRARQIEARGEKAWKNIYSAASLAGFILLVWGYGQARQSAPDLWYPPVWTSHVAALLMFPAFILLVASNLPSGRIKAAVKHPMLLATKIWALAHLLANGDLASILLFGSFLAWAIVDRISEKKRLLAGLTQNPVAGPVKWDIISVISGLALYVLFVVWLHQWLIGVAPFVMR